MVFSFFVVTVISVRRADLSLIGVAAVWGSSYLVVKHSTAGADASVVLFWRYALAAIACVLLVVASGTRTTRHEWRAGIPLGLAQAAMLVLETYGVRHTSASNAGVLISVTIILTLLLDAWSRGVGVPRQLLAAASVCVLGVAVIAARGGLAAPRSGDLLVLGAAVVRAGHVVLIGRISREVPLRPLHLTATQTMVGTAVIAPFALTHPTPALADSPWWGQMVYLALGCGVFAFLTQAWAVHRSSPTRAGLLLGTEPVWAVVIAVSIGGEALSSAAVIGAALVVGGCWWGQRVEVRQRIPHIRERAMKVNA